MRTIVAVIICWVGLLMTWGADVAVLRACGAFPRELSSAAWSWTTAIDAILFGFPVTFIMENNKIRGSFYPVYGAASGIMWLLLMCEFANFFLGDCHLFDGTGLCFRECLTNGAVDFWTTFPSGMHAAVIGAGGGLALWFGMRYPPLARLSRD